MAGTSYDRVVVTGTVTLTGALAASLGFVPAPGQVFTIIDNDGSDAVIGTFAGLAESATFTVGGRTLRISYTGGTGNDVTLTNVIVPTFSVVASPGVAFGGAVTDTATIGGGSAPTGSVTFRLFGPNDATCAGTPVFTDTRSVAGNGAYVSASFTPTATGVYRWIASYSGDGANAEVSGACNATNQSVTISRANQTITFGPLGNRILGTPPFTVSATADSGLPVSFSSTTPSVCTVSGTTVTLVALGTCTIAADQAGNSNYNAAPQVPRSFSVLPNCTVPSLSPAQLPAGLVAIPYTQALTLTNGAAPVTFALTGGLPAGLSFAGGVFSGVPTQQGAFAITVTATDANSCQASTDYTVAIAAERRLLTGAASRASTVRSFNIASGIVQSEQNPFGTFTGGTSVAQGDVDGNGVTDAVVGAGPGGTPHVLVFDGFSRPRLSFVAFNSFYGLGVEVATGDITADGRPEILAAAGCDGVPEVRAFDGVSGALVRRYLLSLPARSCRLAIGAGDLTGDGIADLVVGAADLGASFVTVVNGVSGAVLREFYPFSTGFTGGVSVAVGDVTGDGFADIITGAGPGSTPEVRIFDGVTGNQIAGPLGSFVAYTAAFGGGVRVGAGDLTGDGRSEVMTGAGPGGGPHVRVWDGATATEIYGLYVFDPSFPGGAAVAGPPVGAGRMYVDIPGVRTSGTEVRIAGWALRETALDTAGTDAIHAWAIPAGGGAAVFVGAAPGRVPRPDVAAAFGGQFLMAGFDFPGTLAAGAYDLIVYARNSRTLLFDQARVIRITVP